MLESGTLEAMCQGTSQIDHSMHGHGAPSHLGTLFLHQRVHNMFEQLFATYLEAVQRLLDSFCYLRAYKIGYSWPISAGIQHI